MVLVYTISRISEGILLIVGIVCLYLLLRSGGIGISEETYAQILGTLLIRANYLFYQIAMLILGLGNIVLLWFCTRHKLFPNG